MFTNPKKLFVAITPTLVISWLMTLIGIYRIGKYGMAIFIGTPFFIGFSTTLIYGLESKQAIPKKELYLAGLLALALFAIGILIFALEGLICIIMAAPLGALFTWIGSIIAARILSRKNKTGISLLAISLTIYPSTFLLDKAHSDQTDIRAITTSIEIKSSPEKVWSSVVGFTPITESPNLLFKLGIAYPTHAEISGDGVEAVRQCYFSTGKFVEPITVWNPPNTLEFDVTSQPEPMTELTVWKIHPPHLEGYFVSKKGRFKISKLENGNTLLSGTTWYYQKIFPTTYWYIWSDAILHAVHKRVLTHIKNEIEGSAA
jgi:hypothetical protein